jgi:acetyltransferase-like isoleucine patch superfamily enzyme
MMAQRYESEIRGEIRANNIRVGKGVVVEEGVIITGPSGPAESVVLGDYSYIGRDTRIIVPSFSLGDYSKLHALSFCHGAEGMQIGRNCWIGGQTVLDSLGGLAIDDNVGIGAHSQIWTHIKFGDIVEGCRFHSTKYMHVKKDAWFVGHCIVSPVEIGERSMAMVGSVVTRDMLPNNIYAGVPAKNISDKVGFQFEERTIEEKIQKMEEIIHGFEQSHPEYKNKIIAVADRTYTKKHTEAEVAFMKENVPLIKFVPKDEPVFVNVQEVV